MTKEQALFELIKFFAERMGYSVIDLDGEITVYDKDCYLVLCMNYEEEER
jgi:hypothetical protein